MSTRCSRLLAAALLVLPLAACIDDNAVTEPERSFIKVPGGTDANAVTILTHNLYLGANIEDVGTVPFNQVPFAVAQIVADLQTTDFSVRAQALADEIAALNPQLVGLQEVSLWRTQTPGDFLVGNMTPNATTVAYDFLALLMSALNQRGLQYTVAAQTTTSDIEAPYYTGAPGWPFSDLRWGDSEVILVRNDVNILSSFNKTFDDFATWNVGSLSFYEKRGFAAVTVEIGRRQLTFVNTHLLGQDNATEQVAEANELITWLGSQTNPLILVGDFNSAANPNAPAISKTATYGMLLNAGFTDLWDRGHKPDSGLGCCTDKYLQDATTSNYDQRLDLILLNQQVGRMIGSAQLQVVGNDVAVRNALGMWPSDHAGLFATLHMPMR